MNNDLPSPSQPSRALRIFGVGDAGIKAVDLLIADGISPEVCYSLNSGGQTLDQSKAHRKSLIENKQLRGLGSGGDPERGRQAAEEKLEEIKAWCEGAEVVFILAGLGGGSGTGISPVVAQVAKAAGALVLGFVTLPFECEGTRREMLAEDGLEEFKTVADGVICLPNQKIFRLIEENTTVIESFRIINRLLADGVQALWRLFTMKGLIDIPLQEVIRLLQDRHSESVFAVAEAVGTDRAGQVLEKLFDHPLLEDGEALPASEAVLVSLGGGAGLTMAEVNRIMEQIKAKCGSAQVMMGACIDERFGERIVVALVATSKPDHDTVPVPRAEELHRQLLDRKSTTRPNSRFLPPPPTLAADQVQQLLSRQGRGRLSVRKHSAKMRQTQLPLEIVSKGRFDKSEPTIHKGEDLDVPTYIRRGVSLN